ncbi:MAG: 7-cyano-7-deazaguanine synthase [Deltaproteobacteria bacterium]|nr:7-cyano-7-deazaguanine synthase [Deltaproteobacteria bacterium]
MGGPAAAEKTKVSLLFSGGIDSAMCAVKLADKYDEVHLVSYQNGFGHYKLSRTAKRAKEISRRYPPGKFRHTLLSTMELFEPLMNEATTKDYEEIKSGFVWCMSCKLAMHTRTIAYNLEHGISRVADGSSSSTTEMVEQTPFTINTIRAFYEEYGMEFETPVYDQSREESIKTLKAMGFKMGVRIGDRFLGIQPKCRAGELYYLPYLLLGTYPDHDEKQVIGFIRGKLDIARDWIDGHCRSVGVEPPRRLTEAETDRILAESLKRQLERDRAKALDKRDGGAVETQQVEFVKPT